MAIIEAASSTLVRFVEASDVDSNGVLTIDIDSNVTGALMEIDDGITIRGIYLLANSGDGTGLYESTLGVPWFLVRCRPGAAVTLVHEDVGLDAKYRIDVAGHEADLVLTPSRLLWLTYSEAAQRWMVFDFSDAYQAANSTDWVNPKPMTHSAADDRLVARARRPMLALPELRTLVTGTTTGLIYRGPSGTIDAMDIVLWGGLTILTTTTIQLAINGTPVVDGEVSIAAANAGSGTTHSTTPTSANTIADGDVISVTTGGLNLLATRASVTVRIDAPV